MKSRNGYIVIILIISGLMSCTEVYNPEIAETSTGVLVVEGVLRGENTVIHISRTSELYALENFPVENATVWVESEEGSSDLQLIEENPGSYHGDLILNSSDRYRLGISANGSEYYSEYVSVINAPEIDTITWFARDENNIELLLTTEGTDNGAVYYRWDYIETWEYHPAYQSGYIYKDDDVFFRNLEESKINRCFIDHFSNEVLLATSEAYSENIIPDFKLKNIAIASDPRLDSRYSILVRQYVMTQEAFNFWQTMKKNTESLGTLFDAQPSLLNSNIYCVTDPNQPVIGFISAGLVTSKRIFIDHNDLPFNFRYNRYPTCRLDSVDIDPVSLASTFSSGFYIPVVPFGVYVPIGYLYSTENCVDCRKHGGSITVPDFWIE